MKKVVIFISFTLLFSGVRFCLQAQTDSLGLGNNNGAVQNAIPSNATDVFAPSGQNLLDTAMIRALQEENERLRFELLRLELRQDLLKKTIDSITIGYKEVPGKNLNVKHRDGTSFTVNFDVGTSNYFGSKKLSDNELYQLEPLGSWYSALSSVQRTHVYNLAYLEWGVGASWYNFKFQDPTVRIAIDDLGTSLVNDTRNLDFKSSKLGVVYLNASLIPLADFGWRKTHSIYSFRVGFGPYFGYRLDSFFRQVNEDDGRRDSEFVRDDFNLRTFHYGLRLQVGILRRTDIFFNFDLSRLFNEGEGPKLKPVSFGISF